MNAKAYYSEQRGHARLKTTSEFNETSWSYAREGVIRSLFAKRFPSLVVDISDGGMGLLTKEPIEPNSNISVLVSYRDYRSFPMTGRVRHCETLRYESKDFSGLYYRVSIQLQYNSGRPLEQYKRLLRRVAKATGIRLD